MASQYGGTLGLLAFLSCLIRGLIHGSAAQATLETACLALAAFAVIGLVLGRLAGNTVEEAVQSRLAAELAEEKQQPARPAPTKAAPPAV